MSSPYAPHLKLVLGTFFWALTPVCGKLLADFDAPYALAFLRFLIATTALGFALRVRGQPLAAKAFDTVPHTHTLATVNKPALPKAALVRESGSSRSTICGA